MIFAVFFFAFSVRLMFVCFFFWSPVLLLYCYLLRTVFTFCVTSCFGCRCDPDEPPKSMLFNTHICTFSKIPSLRYTVNMGPRLYSMLISVLEAAHTKQVNIVCSCDFHVYIELRSKREPESTSRKQLQIRKFKTK